MSVIAPERLDRRVDAYREDLAAAALRGRVEARRFAEGAPKQVVAPFATMRGEPEEQARTTSQLLFGDRVTVFDEAEGWAWVQNDSDGYVGYVRAETLDSPGPEPTHRVTALRSFVFPEPNLKVQPLRDLSFWSALSVEGEEDGWARLAGGGWIFRKHLCAINQASLPPHPNPLPQGEGTQTESSPMGREWEGEGVTLPAAFKPDYAATALRFLGVPYLWGGRTSLGLDCSALVQLSLAAAGIPCPRDSDMQQDKLGYAVANDGPYRRGDIVFFPGHVGIMIDETSMVHANAFHMAVAVEPLADAAARVPVTGVRRL